MTPYLTLTVLLAALLLCLAPSNAAPAWSFPGFNSGPSHAGHNTAAGPPTGLNHYTKSIAHGTGTGAHPSGVAKPTGKYPYPSGVARPTGRYPYPSGVAKPSGAAKPADPPAAPAAPAAPAVKPSDIPSFKPAEAPFAKPTEAPHAIPTFAIPSAAPVASARPSEFAPPAFAAPSEAAHPNFAAPAAPAGPASHPTNGYTGGAPSYGGSPASNQGHNQGPGGAHNHPRAADHAHAGPVVGHAKPSDHASAPAKPSAAPEWKPTAVPKMPEPSHGAGFPGWGKPAGLEGTWGGNGGHGGH